MVEEIRKVYSAMNFYSPDTGQLSAIARLGRGAEFDEIIWMLEQVNGAPARWEPGSLRSVLSRESTPLSGEPAHFGWPSNGP
jgi:hypothetical protein